MEKTYLISMKEEELEALIMRCFRTALAEWNTNKSLEPQATIGGMELAARITGLAKQTIYGLVSKRILPHKKAGKRLYFMESELVDWINSHHRKTRLEIEQEAQSYIDSRPLPFKKTSRK